MSDNQSVLMAVFAGPEEMLDAVRALRATGRERKMEALSPIDLPELDELLPQPPSDVRRYTLIGALLGAAGMMAYAIMCSALWPLVTAGKRIISIPAFIPITFELMVLIGSIGALIGLFILAKLPGLTYEPYYSGASQTEFALFVWHEPDERDALVAQLRQAGAREVKPYEAPYDAKVTA